MTELLAHLQALAEAPSTDPVGASIELLLMALGPEAARHLELSAIPHEFDSTVLQILDPALDREGAASRCAQFRRLSIVLESNSHLVFHDEARRFLFRRWLASEQDGVFREASRRLREYFSKPDLSAPSAVRDSFRRSEMFHLLGVDRDAGFERFETLCRQARMEARYHECRHLINLVGEYRPVLGPEKLLWLTFYEGNLAADLRQFQEGEEAFRSILGTAGCSPELRVQALMGLGFVFQEQRRWDEALAHFDEALELARQTPEQRDDIQTLIALGITYRESGKLTQAERYLSQAVKVATREDDPECLSAALNSLGGLHLRRGDARRAIAAFEKSLLHESGQQTARIYHNLGSAYAAASAWERSEEYFRWSLKIKERQGDLRGQALTLNNLVQVHSSQDRFDDAAKAAWQAVDLLTRVHDFQAAGRAARNLARLYRKTGDLQEAESVLERAAELFRRAGEETEAITTENEATTLGKRVKVPVVAWIVLVVGALFVVLVLVALVVELL